VKVRGRGKLVHGIFGAFPELFWAFFMALGSIVYNKINLLKSYIKMI